jgi:hypothetical protein
MTGGVARFGGRALLIFAVMAISVSLSLGVVPVSWRGLLALCVLGTPVVVLGEWLFDESRLESRPAWVKALRVGSGFGLIVGLNVVAFLYREPLRSWLVM